MDVSEMQWKLSRWAKQDKNKQFYGLYDLLCELDRQRESPLPGNWYGGFGGGGEETCCDSNAPRTYPTAEISRNREAHFTANSTSNRVFYWFTASKIAAND